MKEVKLGETSLETAVQTAIEILTAGGILLYPTDTLYGLGVDPKNEDAVRRLKELKGRDANKPIAVILPDVATMESYGVLNVAAHTLATNHLPGPLTLIVPARPSMPDTITLNGTIGMRIPNDPFCLALAKAYGRPITTTSANVAGLDTLPSVAEILEQFGPKADEIVLIIDDGPRTTTLPSTVVSCVEETPRIVREGALSKTDLRL